LICNICNIELCIIIEIERELYLMMTIAALSTSILDNGGLLPHAHILGPQSTHYKPNKYQFDTKSTTKFSIFIAINIF